MRKMLSVALGFVLLTSLLFVPSGAAAAAQRIYEATRYIEEDFDGHTGVVDSSLTPTVGSVAAISAEVVNDADKGSDVLKVDGIGQRYTVWFADSQPAKSKVAVEFDFMAQSTVSGNGMTGLVMLEANNSSSAENLAWWLALDGSVLRAPGVTAITDTNFAGKWYSVRVLYDVNTGYTEWYAAEYGRELTLKGTNTRLIAEANRGKLNRLNIQNCSGFYVDNVKAYEYVTADDAEKLIAQAEQTLFTADVVTPSVVSYTEEAKADLSNAIAAAKASVAAAETAADLDAASKALRAAYQSFLGNGVQDYTTIFEGNFSANGNLSDGTFLKYGTIEPADDPTDAGRTNIARLTPTDSSYGARLLKDGQISGNRFVLKSSFMQSTKAKVEQVLFLFAGGNNGQHEVLAIYTDGQDMCLRYSDKTSGYATSTAAKTAKLIENYAADTWYDIEARIDFTTREVILYVNGTPMLTDRTLYITGSSAVSGSSYRACSWCNLNTADIYVADMGLYQDTSSDIISVFSNLGMQLAGVTGKEEEISLPSTIDSYSISWSSDDFEIAQSGNQVVAYPTYLATAYSGKLTASIVIGSTAYSSVYALPVSAAPSVKTVIDHDYNVEAGTKVNTIDSAYWSAVGSIPAVTTLEGSENGVLLLDGQRLLYSIPESNRLADIVVLEMDIMVPERAAKNDDHILMFGNSSGRASVQLKLEENDIALVPGDYVNPSDFPEADSPVWSIPILQNYELNTWYKLTVVQNFISRTYKILVDGQPALDNMNITLPQPIRNAGRLSFYGGAESKFYMDNLKLYDADLESLSPSAAKKEVQVDRYASAEVPIYPVSQAADGTVLADDYTYTISGEHTEDFSIVRGGVLVVPETVAVGTVATVTATSKYNPQLMASTTVEIISGLSKKNELFEGTKKLASPQEAEGTTIAAKLALTNDTTVAYSEGVIAAVYKNGVLVDAGVGAVKDLIGETVVTLDLKLPEDKTGVVVKIFELESLTNLKPLHAPECFAAEKK